MKTRKFAIKEIADILQARLQNTDENFIITGIGTHLNAGENDIVVVKDEANLQKALQTQAKIFVSTKGYTNIKQGQLLVSDIDNALITLLKLFSPIPLPGFAISPSAVIAETAIIADNVYIGNNVSIGENVEIGDHTCIYPNVVLLDNTKIGKNCILYPNVTCYSDTLIGNNVIIHANSAIGSDGYGYVAKQGIHEKVPQIGGVIIEDNVEIGSNCSIDRATIGYTLIGSGTKVDNLVQIAHNVVIGKNSLIVSQTGIAGSSTIGENCILAGQVGITDHVTLGDNVILGARAATNRDIKTPGLYIGSPCRPFAAEAKIWALLGKLPELFNRVRRLEKK